MSGLLAIVDSTGESMDPSLLDRMLDAQQHRGPERRGRWIDAQVALGCVERAVTPEAVDERQPHADESGAVRLVLDGRIDNRDELAGALGAAGRVLRGETDVELLLRAYQEWGGGCAARLLGDFAFAVWDAPRRVLTAARDVMGLRPLYVHAGASLVALASEIAPLLRHPRVGRAPNEGFVGELLAGQIVSCADTVWRDVQRVPPGHVLTARGGRVTLRRYWTPDPGAEIRYARDEDYAEHLNGLIRGAVRARLRSRGPVGVMLSGGLDSSTIVGAVHDAGGARPRLTTYSNVAPGESWDESRYIDAVAAMWPIDSRRFPATEPAGDCFSAYAATREDLPLYPNGVMAHSMFAAASADGVRVLLTGIGGDEWLTGSPYYYADLLRRGRLGRFWRHLRAQPDRSDVFNPPSMFRAAAWPLVFEPARRAVKRVLGRDGIPPWVDRRFAAAALLADRLRPSPPSVRFPTLAKTETWRQATSGWEVHALETEHRSAAEFGLDTRHPFIDRRIIEFGLAIPEDQCWRGALTKFVLRNAARRWLPPLVRERTTYASAGPVVLRAVERQVRAGLWRRATAVRLGWVSQFALDGAYEDMVARYRAADEGYEALAFPLWLVCAVELWARHALRG